MSPSPTNQVVVKKALPLLLAALTGCGGLNPDRATAAGRVDSLSAAYWEHYIASNPLAATFLGDRRFNHRLDDISPAGRDSVLGQYDRLVERLAETDTTGLGNQARISYLALGEEIRNIQARRACRFDDWNVDHRNGPHVVLLNVAAVQRARSPAEGQQLLARWQAIPAYLDQHLANLRVGRERGQVPTAAAVRKVVAQLDGLLEQPADRWPFLQPGVGLSDWEPERRDAFRRALQRTVIQELRPAFARLRNELRDEVLPRARPDSEPGLAHVPGGEECYRGLIRSFTSLDLTPEEIHEMGEAELERIHVQMRTLGGRVLDTRDLREIQRILRNDPAFHFRSEDEILWTAEEAALRASAVVEEWFIDPPAEPLVVRPIPDYEAPYTQVAYYRQPAVDGSQPGTYFVNTYRPETRPRYQAEVLAFHEGIPGHHFQSVHAQRLGELPVFRRLAGSTAFLEGWALYSEQLADEMGLYSSDVDRLGALSYDAWRASRLIVDTGLHAFGWPRQRAIDFLERNTLLSRENIENEVDRYITWPGQALAYKIGQLEILALRTEAKQRLGAAFDIREFHQVVLGSGAVSLSILRELVDHWIESELPGRTP